MKVRLILIWAVFFSAFPVMASEKSVPEWLQGRASDTEFALPVESSSTIDALCRRPRDVSEFMRNLKEIWDKKLLTQPAFFHRKSLMCFFGGVSVTWKNGGIDGADASRRSATITLDESIFPHSTIQAQLLVINEAAIPGLPKRVHYSGILNVSVEDTSSLKLDEVRGIFGPDFRKLNLPDASPHGSTVFSPPKKFVCYLYPGDDPEKYGVAELPQIRFQLKSSGVAASQVERYETHGDDVIASIFMRERANRR